MGESGKALRTGATASAFFLAVAAGACSSDEAAAGGPDAGLDGPLPAKFAVKLEPRAIVLSPGAAPAAVRVLLERQADFNDQVTIALPSPPFGMSAEALVIAAGATSGTLMLSAPGAAEGTVSRVDVAGTSGAMRAVAPLEVTTTEPAPLPDPSFGIGGKMRIGAGVAREVLAAAALQADGKLVAVGAYRTGYTTVPAVARYLPTGALDATFGAGGIVLLDAHDGSSALGVAIQADGKIVLLEPAAFTVSRLQPSGAIDASFGAAGTASAAFPGEAVASALAIQPDGKIVVAGSATVTDRDFALARFGSDGALDLSFGTGGLVTTAATGTGDDGATSIALETSGATMVSIVVAGTAATPSGRQIAVARYTPQSGALDATFDGDGVATFSAGVATEDAAAGVAVASGKIVVVGRRHAAAVPDLVEVLRFTGAGVLDATFAGSGVKTLALGPIASASGVVVTGTKIVVAGEIGNSSQGVLARLDDTGTLDTTFGALGTVTAAFGDVTTIRAITAAADGSLSIAGSATLGTDPDALVARFTALGALDTAFAGGRTTTSFGPGDEEIRAIAIQPDGSIVAGGSAFNGTDFDFLVARILPTGRLDLNFAGRGYVLYDHANSSEFVYDVRVLDDGRILAGGQGGPGALVIRLTAAGALDATFGTGGVAAITGADGLGMSLQAPGSKIIVGGPGTGGDFFVARLTADGVLDTSGAAGVGFGATGTVTTDFGLADRATALAVDPAGKVVVAGLVDHAAPPNFFDLAVARYEPTGAPDLTFGKTGRATFDTSNVELLYAVAVQPDEKILLGGRTQRPSRASSLGVFRIGKGGDYDLEFGQGGRALTDLADGSQASAFAIEPNGMIVVAGRTGDDRLALIRLSPSGAPIWPNGQSSIAYGSRAEAFAVARQADGRLLVGGVGHGRLEDIGALVRYAK